MLGTGLQGPLPITPRARAVDGGRYAQTSTSVTDARSIPTGAYDQDWSNYTLELDATKTAGSEGFLVGFGAAFGGGCTSGHAISGLADLQLPSLVAVLSFFAGGLIGTHVLLPLVLS